MQNRMVDSRLNKIEVDGRAVVMIYVSKSPHMYYFQGQAISPRRIAQWVRGAIAVLDIAGEGVEVDGVGVKFESMFRNDLKGNHGYGLVLPEGTVNRYGEECVCDTTST